MVLNKELLLKKWAHLLSLSWTYPIKEEFDNSKLYIIEVAELPGVITDATTIDEAMELIKEPMMLAFESYEKEGLSIPQPIALEQTAKGIA